MTPVRNALQPLLVLAFCLSSLPAQTNVLTYRNDNMRTAQNLTESILTPANVKQASFGKLLNLPVDGKVDAQPLVVSGLTIPGQGVHDVVFAVTEHASAYAFDANTGAILWQVSALKAGEIPSDNRGCGQVTPEIGITATPVIDLAAGPHGAIYLVAMSKTSTGSVYHQRLHALDLTTGAEQFNGPVDIQATYPGTGDNSSNGQVVFDPKQYKDRTALLLVNGVVYTSWASHCDIRPYTGWTIGYDQSTLAQKGVFNFTPNGNEAAIWGAGGGVSADASGNLYFDLGNGTFDTTLTAGGFPAMGDFGNSFVKLAPSNGTLTAVDYWTMFNTVAESNADADLGSGGVMLLPDLRDAQGNIRHLGTGAGKDRNVYVFDRDNMGKFNPNNNGNIYQQLATALSGGEFASPAYFNGYVYYGSVGDVIRAFKVTSALLGTTPAFTSQTSFGYPGTSPSISASGNANGILWAVQNSSPAVLHAYDANDLVTELYNSSQAGTRDQFGPGNKFITPTIANGKVFVGTQNSVAVFGNIGATLTNLSPSTGVQGSQVNVTLTGTNFASGASVAVSGSGVTASNVSVVSATQLTATLVIGATAATGSYNVSVTTGGSTTNALPFNVTAGSGGAPVLTSITPSSGSPGASVNVTLAGSNFTPQSSIRLSGLGASVRNAVVVSATQITATFVLSSSVATGPHNVYVVTAAGNSNILPFTVTSGSGAPTLTSVAPNSGAQGTAVNITLTGTNFASGASIAVSGSGVTASNVNVVSATQITATLTISASAAAGARSVSVTEAAGTSNGITFTVTAAAQAPTLTSVSPNSGTQGTAVNITLTGANFASGASIAVSGSGVTAGNVSVVSATQITATLTIAAGAPVGGYSLSVSTAAGTSNTVSFTVNASGGSGPTIASLSPNSGTAGTSVQVTITGANFTPQASVRLAGVGAAVRNVVVVSPTQINVTFVLQPTTATGPHNVYVVTGAGNSNIVPFTVN